jgi:hypothetical protein
MVEKQPIEDLQEDFRRQLELFYSRLKLAPPYHSIEKAVLWLKTTLNAMDPESRVRVAEDRPLRWAAYSKAFVESNLHLKHRGIIAGLLRENRITELPAEHEHFLKAYRTSP